jgi:hypothetical protein
VLLLHIDQNVPDSIPDSPVEFPFSENYSLVFMDWMFLSFDLVLSCAVYGGGSCILLIRGQENPCGPK